jgi:hypothetical protein
MTFTNKTPPHKDSSQQARQKTTPVPPSAPPSDGNKNARRISSKMQVTSQEREQLIATAAYFRAQQRGFAPGYEEDDWLQAEAEVDRLLRRK